MSHKTAEDYGNDIRSLLKTSSRTLAKHQINYIYVDYSGEEDSGRIGSVVGMRTLGAMHKSLEDVLSEKTYDKLYGILHNLIESVNGGYENNEGGGGEINIHVENGYITHQAYYFEPRTRREGAIQGI